MPFFSVAAAFEESTSAGTAQTRPAALLFLQERVPSALLWHSLSSYFPFQEVAPASCRSLQLSFTG
jgi:hypothetical protein